MEISDKIPGEEQLNVYEASIVGKLYAAALYHKKLQIQEVSSGTLVVAPQVAGKPIVYFFPKVPAVQLGLVDFTKQLAVDRAMRQYQGKIIPYLNSNKTP